MFALRNTPGTDSGISPSEIVFGERQSFPGEVLRDHDETSFNSFVSSLKLAIRKQIPSRPEWHQASDVNYFVPKQLRDCDHVFVRIDRVQPGLKLKFDGPFRVISRKEKVFTLDIDGKDEA
ncbi:Hypothetical predicted protein, partial [Paramuricea clavata]